MIAWLMLSLFIGGKMEWNDIVIDEIHEAGYNVTINSAEEISLDKARMIYTI